MQYLIRLRDWWLDQFRSTSRLGKAAMFIVPLMFGCCFLTMASLLLVPPAATPEPTADIAARSQPTAEPNTVQPTAEPTLTDRPARAAIPAAGTATEPATAQPTTAPTDRPTATPRPSNTPPPTATAMPPTATRLPPTAVPPTAVPPTATAVRVATVALPTAVPPTAAPPTAAPLPTATQPLVAAPGDVFISSIFYNGVVDQVESDEYAVITNRGAAVVNLGGWRLNAGEPDQNFTFPSFDLQPGQSCRVYTNEPHPESCGFSFGIGSAIWRNSGDCGTLHDATGAEVSRYCWS